MNIWIALSLIVIGIAIGLGLVAFALRNTK